MAEETHEVTCPYCDANVSVSKPKNGVFQGATKSRKDADHVHEVECAMCEGHFYVHYSLN